MQKSLTPSTQTTTCCKGSNLIISHNGDTVNTVNTLNLEKIKIIKKELRRWLSVIEVDYKKWQKVGEPDVYSSNWLGSHFEGRGIGKEK